MTTVLFEELPGDIGRLYFNDPDSLNAMSERMAEDFRSQVEALSKRATPLRAIILSGKGKAFSAGGDLQMLEAKTRLSAEENHRRMIQFYNSFLGLRDLKVPLIAAINGAAIGAGLCVASACDIRICAENAKLGFTFVKLGLHPGMGGTYFLPQVVGEPFARELLLTGRVIDATEALRVGLVSRVVALDQLEDQALSIAREICANGPLSVSQLVETLRGDSGALKRALEREAACQAINYASPEFKEGISAIREKRAPRFSH